MGKFENIFMYTRHDFSKRIQKGTINICKFVSPGTVKWN